MNTPSVARVASGINYTWTELKLRVLAERITDYGRAELSFYNSTGALFHTARVDLMSTSAIDSLIRRLDKHSQDIQWSEVLTFITGKTIEIARRGEPEQDIWPEENDILAPVYLLDPLLYMNHPTVLFGDYGSCKSLIALLTAYIVQLPAINNDFGLTTTNESSRCLFLDYEDDDHSFKRRWGALERGIGKVIGGGIMPICYKRMTAPLAESVEQVQNIIADKAIKLVIIDSLGPAARGNLNDPEPAIKYHSALRQLNVTSLTLAHCSKDQLTKRRTIFGSVFFTNLARAVWECKAEQEMNEDEVIISLKQTKANLSKLHSTMGYRISFSGNAINVSKTNLKDTGLSRELPIPWQIKDALRDGPLTAKEIAELIDKGEDSIKTTLSRMAGKGELVKLPDHKWGLRAHE